jgi:predicted amidohydrolase
MKFLAAVVQLTTTDDAKGSIERALDSIDRAAAQGAKLVVLPENVSYMGTEAEKKRLAEPITGPTFARFGEKSKQHGIWLLAGSMPEASSSGRPFNTSVLFDPEGRRAAVYRKIHLFDVSLGAGATHMESEHVEPGTSLSLAETSLGKIGMSICYDLRFPDLYRAYRRAGAEMLTVPAAFTVPTGRDHWEVLLRARAIENQAFVFAAGQFGQNTPTRTTFGRSMIIDPWGTVLATCPDRPSIAVAEIDLSQVESFRQKLPCLQHERHDAYKI